MAKSNTVWMKASEIKPPDGYVRCTSPHCTGTLYGFENHAHPIREGDFIRMGCGMKINVESPLYLEATSFMLALDLSAPSLLYALEETRSQDPKIHKAFRLALAYKESPVLLLQA